MSEVDSGVGAARLIAWPEVHDLTGLSRTTVWRLQRTGAFPSPVTLSPGRVGWLAAEVAEWTRARLEREPLDSDRFERRPGGRPPAWTAGGRPSARRERAKPSLRADPVGEAQPIIDAAAEPERRASGRRARPEAPGQLAFDF